nr:ribosomal protein L20 [Cylindrocapsa geminella]
MTRVKRGIVAKKRRKKILKISKGFRGSSSSLFRTANQRVLKSLTYSYINSRKKKRIFRRLWITRLNSFSRRNGLNYHKMVSSFQKISIKLNRKTLSQLAIFDQTHFSHFLQNTISLM